MCVDGRRSGPSLPSVFSSSLQEFIKLQEQREYEKELKTNPLARPPPGLNVKTPYAFTAGPGMGSGQSGVTSVLFRSHVGSAQVTRQV